VHGSRDWSLPRLPIFADNLLVVAEPEGNWTQDRPSYVVRVKLGPGRRREDRSLGTCVGVATVSEYGSAGLGLDAEPIVRILRFDSSVNDVLISLELESYALAFQDVED
jgi:hypothetical protein